MGAVRRPQDSGNAERSPRRRRIRIDPSPRAPYAYVSELTLRTSKEDLQRNMLRDPAVTVDDFLRELKGRMLAVDDKSITDFPREVASQILRRIPETDMGNFRGTSKQMKEMAPLEDERRTALTDAIDVLRRIVRDVLRENEKSARNLFGTAIATKPAFAKLVRVVRLVSDRGNYKNYSIFRFNLGDYLRDDTTMMSDFQKVAESTGATAEQIIGGDPVHLSAKQLNARARHMVYWEKMKFIKSVTALQRSTVFWDPWGHSAKHLIDVASAFPHRATRVCARNCILQLLRSTVSEPEDDPEEQPPSLCSKDLEYIASSSLVKDEEIMRLLSRRRKEGQQAGGRRRVQLRPMAGATKSS